MKKCLHCGYEVEDDDNFCPKCGAWTAKGYSFLSDSNQSSVINGNVIRQNNRMASLFLLLFVFCIISIGICLYRGKDILQPFVYIKRQIMNYNYGYYTTILKTDNQYLNQDVVDVNSAKDMIIRDFSEQEWQCKDRYEMSKIEDELENSFGILSVNFCDISIEEGKRISDVIKKVYDLFPNMRGYLTNISITNAKKKDEYVAYFQPVYQFVNSANDLDNYNRVNKTQILLNSYYFANDNVLNNSVKDNWYVKDASWESLIVHEFGHYITFVTLLKKMGINDIVLVNNGNYQLIDQLVDIINSESYSMELVNRAIENYNNQYHTNIDIDSFSFMISHYANNKDIDGNYIYDEIIAEAVHDYYLHGDNAYNASLEIVSILKSRMW